MSRKTIILDVLRQKQIYLQDFRCIFALMSRSHSFKVSPLCKESQHFTAVPKSFQLQAPRQLVMGNGEKSSNFCLNLTSIHRFCSVAVMKRIFRQLDCEFNSILNIMAIMLDSEQTVEGLPVVLNT